MLSIPLFTIAVHQHIQALTTSNLSALEIGQELSSYFQKTYDEALKQR